MACKRLVVPVNATYHHEVAEVDHVVVYHMACGDLVLVVRTNALV
jgi:hypothetical protein